MPWALSANIRENVIIGSIPDPQKKNNKVNFNFFIARRYLFSKKSHHAINIISGISACGVAVATMAMVCILSVFNGFQEFVADLFTSFDPELEIVSVKGASFPANHKAIQALRHNDRVAVLSECVEGKALVVQGGQQVVVTVRGVEDNFLSQVSGDELFFGTGQLILEDDKHDYGILGIGLAVRMGLQAEFDKPLTIYAPKKGERVNPQNPLSSFNACELYSPGVVFQVKQGKYDNNFIITSIRYARELLDRKGEVTSLHLRLKGGENLSRAKSEIEGIMGPEFSVRDRYEQQEEVFHIMNVEKFIAYVFLSFILLVSCFNIVGSLSMLMIDKKKDVETLRNLGASNRQICTIFMLEGRMISIFGAIIGIFVGVCLCLLQQELGLITMGDAEGSFIRESYPVSVHLLDLAVVFFTVIIVGWISVWYPVRYLSKSLLR